MRENTDIAVSCSQVLLVPYEEHHVPQYHKWMENEEIRIATASERLSLQEEHTMQRAWREDANKLTFISCVPPHNHDQLLCILSGEHDAPEKIIGDVNLFLYDSEDEEGEAAWIGEVELMVAEKANQGKGFGRATLLLFLWYVLRHRERIVESAGKGKLLRALSVKIGQDNVASIRLFESVGFVKKSEKPNYFGEFGLLLGELDGQLERIERLMEKYGEDVCRELEYVR